MTDELRPQAPSRKRRFFWILAALFLMVIGAGVGYYSWLQTHTWSVIELEPQTRANINVSAPSIEPEPSLPSTTSPHHKRSSDNHSPVPDEVLMNMNNQAAVIQILLSNQQYAAAINLLTTLENEALLLPTAQQETVMRAIDSDRQQIQNIQTSREQLLGQLQQLQQHINQQMLAYFGPVEAVPSAPVGATSTTFMEKIRKQFSQAVQIRHNESLTNTALPAFYSGVMLELALYQAQFALMQGNWMEYQMVLERVLSWLNPQVLLWLSDADSVTQTLNSLSQKSAQVSAANINQTQQALVNAIQELEA